MLRFVRNLVVVFRAINAACQGIHYDSWLVLSGIAHFDGFCTVIDHDYVFQVHLAFK